jgi:hypothetical protein
MQHQRKQSGCQQFDSYISRRYFPFTIPTLTSQENVAEYRNVIQSTEAVLTVRTVRSLRRRNRSFAWDPIYANVQKTPGDQTKGNSYEVFHHRFMSSEKLKLISSEPPNS